MNNEFQGSYRFGEFVYDASLGLLYRNGESVALSPKSAELLRLLLQRNGDFVSKTEIFATIWPETFVEEGVLTQNIYTLRKALGVTPDGASLIENKTRLGYRLTVPIDVVRPQNDENPQKPLPETESNDTVPVVKRRTRWVISSTVVVFMLLLVVGGVWLRPRIKSLFRKPIESVKFVRLTESGDIANATLSPDGKIIAYVRANAIYLKDLATRGESKIEVPNVESLSSLQFSPDGASIYFRSNKIFVTLARIYRVSRFGGDKELIAERAWASFSVSPDGRKLAFFRNVVETGGLKIVIHDIDSKEETEFTAVETPNTICGNCAPAWSPDGKRLIFTITNPTSLNQLKLLDVASGVVSDVKAGKLRRFEQVAWLPDGESFIVSASDGNRFMHLWKVYFPDGEVQPMTNGLLTYNKVAISADGRKVLALQGEERANIFVAPADKLNEQKQLTFGLQNNFGQTALNWIDDRRVVYSTLTEDKPAENFAVVDVVDATTRSISTEKETSFRFATSDGKRIFFNASKNGFSHIFSMNTDGTDVRQLTTNNDGQRQSPRVSPDGRFIFYTFRGVDSTSIRRFDLEGNREEVFFTDSETTIAPFMELSPDGRFMTFFQTKIRSIPDASAEKYNALMVVIATANFAERHEFMVSIVPPTRRFSPDGRAIDWIYAATDGTQLVRQRFDEKDPTPFYTVGEGRIFNFAWSKNGKMLALSRGQSVRDAVLITDFDH